MSKINWYATEIDLLLKLISGLFPTIVLNNSYRYFPSNISSSTKDLMRNSEILSQSTTDCSRNMSKLCNAFWMFFAKDIAGNSTSYVKINLFKNARNQLSRNLFKDAFTQKTSNFFRNSFACCSRYFLWESSRNCSRDSTTKRFIWTLIFFSEHSAIFQGIFVNISSRLLPEIHLWIAPKTFKMIH